MADATFLVTLSPDTAYATKSNIKFPGTQAAADARETPADDRFKDALPAGFQPTGLDIVANGE